MAHPLAGKVAIVTGAGQGIGKGVALRLARDGADLVVAEYNPETAEAACVEIRALGRQALPYPIDLSQVEMADFQTYKGWFGLPSTAKKTLTLVNPDGQRADYSFSLT